MMTVHEVSKLTGVSIRTLQYYDSIGLLHPAEYTEVGCDIENSLKIVSLLKKQAFYAKIVSGV